MALVGGGANTDLPLMVFRDQVVAGELREDGTPRLGRSGEAAAAGFWLEHRQGRREHSITDMDPRWRQPGRVIPTVDIEGTCEAIERCARIIPPSWRWVTMVACGWSLSVEKLRSPAPRDGGPPYLERAGLPTALPSGFGGRGLDHWQRQFRDQLIRAGLLVGSFVEDVAPSPRAVVFGEPPIEGWKAIAAALGCSVNTAKEREAHGLPIYRTPGSNRVWTFASELRRWLEQQQGEARASA